MSDASNPLVYGLVLLLLSMLPLVLLSLTSFIKISIVFSILRSALGGGQLPSAAITAVVSMVLTAYVMSPVFSSFLTNIDFKKVDKIEYLIKEVKKNSEPLMVFLKKHSGEKETLFFKSLSRERVEESLEALSEDEDLKVDLKQAKPQELDPVSDFIATASAFVLSELKEAFAVGLALYLPFLIIDLVVANVLVGMGMMMVSPISISVPLKIALFVLCDGWYLLCRGLVMSYGQV